MSHSRERPSTSTSAESGAASRRRSGGARLVREAELCASWAETARSPAAGLEDLRGARPGAPTSLGGFASSASRARRAAPCGWRCRTRPSRGLVLLELHLRRREERVALAPCVLGEVVGELGEERALVVGELLAVAGRGKGRTRSGRRRARSRSSCGRPSPSRASAPARPAARASERRVRRPPRRGIRSGSRCSAGRSLGGIVPRRVSNALPEQRYGESAAASQIQSTSGKALTAPSGAIRAAVRNADPHAAIPQSPPARRTARSPLRRRGRRPRSRSPGFVPGSS